MAVVQALAVSNALANRSAVVSLQKLNEKDILINWGDFKAVQHWETDHPELYQEAIVASTDMSYAELLGHQMYAFDWIFKRDVTFERHK